MAARRRLFKHEGIRAAIERGWWPYLPLRWVILNDQHVLKILPRQGYNLLFTAMYMTLVPTADEAEAKETARWEYGEDAKGLPQDLRRAGITLGTFSDALFAVADNWTETVRAMDYIEFLCLLWERVRPDVLFQPLPFEPESDDPPTAPSQHEGNHTAAAAKKIGRKSQKARRKNWRNDGDDVYSRLHEKSRKAANALGIGGGRWREGGGGEGRKGEALDDDRRAPPTRLPPPQTPDGLQQLRIPGFRPKEAQRAAWVRYKQRRIVDPGRRILLAPEEIDGARGIHRGGGKGESSGGAKEHQRQQQQKPETEEQSRKQRGRRRTCVTSILKDADRQREVRTGGSEGYRPREEEAEVEMEEMENIWDFITRNVPANSRERDAFILFVERKQPDLLDNNNNINNKNYGRNPYVGTGDQTTLALGRPISSPSPKRPDVGGGGGGSGGRVAAPPTTAAVVRRYRTQEATWERARLQIVPSRALGELLEAWRSGHEGMTPAEYGAAFIGPPQARDRGAAAFLAHAIANGWGTRAGGVHTQQTLDGVAAEWRRGRGRCPEMDVLWEVVRDLLWDEAEDAIGEALSDGVDLYSIPHRLLHHPPRGRPGHRSSSSSIRRSSARPVLLSPRQRGDYDHQQRHRRASTAPASTHGAAAVEFNGGGVDGGDNGFDRLGGGQGPAGRVLLQGERVAGSVRQGQAAFYQTPCPTERGACLEITLESHDTGSTAPGRSNHNGIPTAINLYAVQAQHRPLRLSFYTWVSRGKTHHRLLLNWKGPAAGLKGVDEEPLSPAPSPPRTGAVISSPWDGVRGFTSPRPATASASKPWKPVPPAPIHIAVVCPEPPLPPSPLAPAFDGSGIGILAAADQADETLDDRGIFGGDLQEPARVEGGATTGSVGGQVAPTRKRVWFTVRVRVVGPPRVVLEGRWYSLPFGADTGGGMTGPHPLAAFATLRLPTPLKATRWGPDSYPEDPFGDRDVSMFAGEEDRPAFVDAETLVTLQARHSTCDPFGVDIYCGTSPRPRPSPADHIWRMPIGGGGDGGGSGVTARVPGAPVSSQPVEGGGRSGNNGTGEEIDAAPGHRQPGDNHHGAAGEVAGAGVSRMTVAMPRDHTGAFHVGVFGRERHKTTTDGGTARGGTINIKARARKRVTRLIEDQFVLKQLEFAQDFHRRFCPPADDDERVPVLGSGRACQGVHTRPFLLASRRISPSQNEYTWRGTNAEGLVEVLRDCNRPGQVLTRYTETLQVCRLVF
ncbi:unnamed protein product, partial [Ectocarpus sp. 13 AM-2016]